MRYMFMRFPGSKFKAVTLSYDDGVVADKRLSDIITEHGVKCTFNLNSSSYREGKAGKLTKEEIVKYMIDRGHEIANHGERHIAPGIASYPLAITDILNSRLQLEEDFDMIVRGMAYPDSGIVRIFGDKSVDEIKSYIKDLGIIYSRTLGGDNNSFMMPNDWYQWMPTAHHNNKNLSAWTEEFLSLKEEELYITRRYPRLFYLWGHSYEFNNNDNWDVIENFCKSVKGKDDIWYATNREICEYARAFDSLVMSANGNMLYNPTLIDLYAHIDGETVVIKSGETVKL